jgi:two-component system invasion response regulator UvrY
MIKVLVADDHPVVREGLKKIFAKTKHIAVAGEARTGQEVLNKFDKNDYDLVLLDITMPGTSWLDVLKGLKTRKPHIPVVILSMHKDQEYIIRALKAGASGYLTKESIMTELIKAVEKVHRGGRFISEAVADRLVGYFDTESDMPPHKTLSDREYEVMIRLARGKTTREIAEELFISSNTVSTYRSRILEKMQMKKLAELIHYALKNNLLD